MIKIVRDPLEYIYSLYVMNNSKSQLDNQLIDEYIEYRKLSLAKHNLIEVVPSEKLTKTSVLLLDCLENVNTGIDNYYEVSQNVVKNNLTKKS